MTIAIIVSTTLTLLLVTAAHAYTRHNSKYTHWYISLRGITELVIKMTGGNGIKYETMTFLTLPPKDVFSRFRLNWNARSYYGRSHYDFKWNV